MELGGVCFKKIIIKQYKSKFLALAAQNVITPPRIYL